MTTTFNAWPDRPDLWNRAFQVTRMLGIIDFGGSDFTEIHEVIQRIRPGDDESWYQEWHRMAELCEVQPVEAERYANRFTARYALAARVQLSPRLAVLQDRQRRAEDLDAPSRARHVQGGDQALRSPVRDRGDPV